MLVSTVVPAGILPLLPIWKRKGDKYKYRHVIKTFQEGLKQQWSTHPLRFVGTEEACVVAFLYHDVRDTRLVVFLQLYACISDGQKLIVENLHNQK